MGAPSSKICPLDGCVSPPSRSMSVDLPQPLGPTRTMNSPSRTLSDTFSSAENLSPERPLRTGNVLLTDTNSILLLALKLSSSAAHLTGLEIRRLPLWYRTHVYSTRRPRRQYQIRPIGPARWGQASTQWRCLLCWSLLPKRFAPQACLS